MGLADLKYSYLDAYSSKRRFYRCSRNTLFNCVRKTFLRKFNFMII